MNKRILLELFSPFIFLENTLAKHYRHKRTRYLTVEIDERDGTYNSPLRLSRQTKYDQTLYDLSKDISERTDYGNHIDPTTMLAPSMADESPTVFSRNEFKPFLPSPTTLPPTFQPSIAVTNSSTNTPTPPPTYEPSISPTFVPSTSPSVKPSVKSSVRPSAKSSAQPSARLNVQPVMEQPEYRNKIQLSSPKKRESVEVFIAPFTLTLLREKSTELSHEFDASKSAEALLNITSDFLYETYSEALPNNRSFVGISLSMYSVDRGRRLDSSDGNYTAFWFADYHMSANFLEEVIDKHELDYILKWSFSSTFNKDHFLRKLQTNTIDGGIIFKATRIFTFSFYSENAYNTQPDFTADKPKPKFGTIHVLGILGLLLAVTFVSLKNKGKKREKKILFDSKEKKEEEKDDGTVNSVIFDEIIIDSNTTVLHCRS